MQISPIQPGRTSREPTSRCLFAVYRHISSIIEAYPIQDGDGNSSKLNTTAEWKFPDDKADFKAEADNITIAKSL